MLNRIVSESVGDQFTGMRKFHVTELLSTNSVIIGDQIFDGEDNFNRLTDFGHKVCKRLTLLPGFVKAYIGGYEMSITIGEAFVWSDLEPMVLELLSLVLDWTEYEYVRRDDAWPYPERDEYGNIVAIAAWRPVQEANYVSKQVKL